MMGATALFISIAVMAYLIYKDETDG